jgi:hypothetical protein
MSNSNDSTATHPRASAPCTFGENELMMALSIAYTRLYYQSSSRRFMEMSGTVRQGVETCQV